jgi:hypothetical protein
MSTVNSLSFVFFVHKLTLVDLYTVLGHYAQFGALFRRIEAIYQGEDEILLRIKGSSIDLSQ